jgi:predicted tellurium resistance membrane protein TerC
MPVLLSLVEILGQKLEVQDLAVVALLVVLEGVLSIDNALVLGLLAKRLAKQSSVVRPGGGLCLSVYRCFYRQSAAQVDVR